MVLGFQKGAEPGRKAVESSRNGAEHDFGTCYVHLLTFPGGMPRFSETDFDELSFGTYVELRYYPDSCQTSQPQKMAVCEAFSFPE